MGSNTRIHHGFTFYEIARVLNVSPSSGSSVGGIAVINRAELCFVYRASYHVQIWGPASGDTFLDQGSLVCVSLAASDVGVAIVASDDFEDPASARPPWMCS